MAARSREADSLKHARAGYQGHRGAGAAVSSAGTIVV